MKGMIPIAAAFLFIVQFYFIVEIPIDE